MKRPSPSESRPEAIAAVDMARVMCEEKPNDFPYDRDRMPRAPRCPGRTGPPRCA